ncbi:hypothetical protein OG535_38310 [Kitasatospora sp. NBC_00085]|uniref:hypothetical protein n=1 Tax=unclassified Kitasatospora TaxID=2633591 RepID=UPI00324D3655
MAIIIVHETPGGTREQYEQVTNRLSGGKGALRSRGDWPAPGLLSHVAGPTADGWLVVDAWESEEAFQRFAEHLMPVLREVGMAEVPPKIYPAVNVVTD